MKHRQKTILSFFHILGVQKRWVCSSIIAIGEQTYIHKGHLYMEIFRVSFIGHREVDDFRFVEDQLERIVRDLIQTKEYVEFYVGRNGEFDIMVASVIKRAKRDYGDANSSMILVLPYPIADMDMMEDFYDEIWLPLGSDVHFKSAITKRNEWLIENSDMLVAYVIRDTGGAYQSVKYAEKSKKAVVHVAQRKEQ